MKKLERSNKNKVLAGIFGGLGEYFDIDPTILRLIGLFLFIWSGFFAFLVVYIIAIFIIPTSREQVKEGEAASSGNNWLLGVLIILLLALIILPLVALFSFRSFVHSSVDIPGFRYPAIEFNLGEKDSRTGVRTEGIQVREATEVTLDDFPQIQRSQIKDYLKNEFISPSFGGEIFADYYIFGKDSNNIYLWAYISEYYKEDGDLQQGTATSLPISLKLQRQEIIGYSIPGDGASYSRDVRNIFPANYHDNILSFQSRHKQVLEGLSEAVKNEARRNL
ncbi:MAG: PspC domain-containing protein [Bacteroidales bacterium]